MIPKFSPLEFVSFYIEVPIMIAMTTIWLFVRKNWRGTKASPPSSDAESEALLSPRRQSRGTWGDLVDFETVDLHRDEYEEDEQEQCESEEYHRSSGIKGSIKVYYWIV